MTSNGTAVSPAGNGTTRLPSTRLPSRSSTSADAGRWLPTITAAVTSAPGTTRDGSAISSTHVSPRSRGVIGSTDTGTPAAARRSTAARESPAVSRPSEKSTTRGTAPGRSSARAASSPRSTSVPERSTTSRCPAFTSRSASVRSAAVSSSAAASAPNTTMRLCAGRSALLISSMRVAASAMACPDVLAETSTAYTIDSCDDPSETTGRASAIASAATSRQRTTVCNSR